MAPPTFAEPIPEHVNFNKVELAIIEFWEQHKCFQRSVELSEGLPEFRFYDGPPFATGLPHYGHLLAGSLKDVVTRYAHQTGHYVPRKFGWDCHGLPVEYEIDQLLEVKNRQDVTEKIGLAVYNEKCRSIVMKYSNEWRSVVNRIGRWIDFESGYKTMDLSFMESVWWVFSQLFEKKLVYKDYKVMPFSTKCSTPLSNFEAGQNYKDVSDPSVIVSFPIIAWKPQSVDSGSHPTVTKLNEQGLLIGSELLAWTTTPWTLPANMGLTVNPEMTYSLLRVTATKRLLWVADARAEPTLKDLKLVITGKAAAAAAADAAAAVPLFEWVQQGVKGSEMADLYYKPPFETFWKNGECWPKAWRVVCDGYVTDDSGTGIVHCAPAFGEDDSRVALEQGITVKGGVMPLHVDDDGNLMSHLMDEDDLKGTYVKTADKLIKTHLKKKERLLFEGTIVHSYPHCWRSDTPLIYRAVPSWFVNVVDLKDKLLANNVETSWVPRAVQEKRFHNWLADARDWCVSRNRFWGTPLPLWISADGEVVKCVSSVADLEEAAGLPRGSVKDLHRHFVDNIEIPDPRSTAAAPLPPLRRVDEVFDCWFESGSMPYASMHYPFEHKTEFSNAFPADFIGEGLDQTRGWFYTLSVLGCALFGQAPFKNVIVNGLVLAEDGKKMSKRLKNYPDPSEVIEEFGADALRIYLISSIALKAESLKFKKDGLKEIMKNILLPWYHSLRFFTQEVSRFEQGASCAFVSVFAEEKKAELALNDMDRWIISMVNSLVKYVREEMDAYRLFSACNTLLAFMDQLTNWYVRLNRDRMRASDGNRENARISLSVLHKVLMNLTLLMAPLAPFMAEFAFGWLRKVRSSPLQLVAGSERAASSLTTEGLSVHYHKLPEFEASLIDGELERRVSELQRVIVLGRQLRERKRLSVKQAVAEIVIRSSNEMLVSAMAAPGFVEYVQRELNALTLRVELDKKSVKTVVQPNLRLLGQKHGAALKALGPAIRALEEQSLNQLLAGCALTVAGVDITREDVLVTSTPVGAAESEHTAVECGEDVALIADLAVSAELKQVHLARELATRIQRLRKDLGLRFDDNANTTYIIGGTEVHDVADAVRDAVKRKVVVVDALPTQGRELGRAHNIAIFAD